MRRSHAILLLALLVSGGVLALLRLPGAPPPGQRPAPGEGLASQTLPLPGYSESPYLNARPGAASHVGSAACAVCHPDNHKSYLLTAHSKALEDVDPAAEPPDSAFEHKPSGRSYRVFRKEGKLWHQEVLKTPEGQEVARTEFPVRYRVGSGHFTRTYIVEADGFLHESPITWYESRKQWDASPGYDRANHGFQRTVAPGCLVCHAGSFAQVGGSEHKLTFHEMAIGCENCHGPGSLHRDFHMTRKLAAGQRDLTIVHPGRLARPLLESICASCHLSTPVSVLVRGRQFEDFLPGLPLSDFRIHYTLAGENNKMTVVGHVEQLRQSKCYQKSEMTCVTCHDPHARARPADPVAFYRQKCLDCHQSCSLPAETRLARNPADNCVACHMPLADTDIQHVAFTHHRIGKRSKGAPPAAAEGAPQLVALDENPRLGEPDRRRNLGLAYKSLPSSPGYERYRKDIEEPAWANLHAAYLAGVRDPQTLADLADLTGGKGDMTSAVKFAREGLGAPDLRPEPRAQCLTLLAANESRQRNLRAASALTEQLVQVRQDGGDWALLGMCYLSDGNVDKALRAFQRSLAIAPYHASTHRGVAECYRRLGDPQRAREHLDKAQWLQDHVDKK